MRDGFFICHHLNFARIWMTGGLMIPTQDRPLSMTKLMSSES